jgi:cytochrome c-type biogenesis protein CcmH/NrfG
MLLESGKWEEAVKTWREILPYLEDGDKVTASIAELENMQQAKQKAEIGAREAELKKDTKLTTPDDMTELIQQAVRQIEVQAETAQSRKRKADLSLADKQTLTSEGYEKGKKLLADGQYTEAFQEWQKILPALDDVVTIKPLLDKAGEQTQLLIQWQRSAKDAESKKDLKVKTPADLSKLLEAALTKIKTETEMAKAKRGVAEESYASRESLIQNTFEKGKLLYDQGQYAEALDVWKKMLSELSDADTIQASIGQIEGSYEKLITARKETETSEKKQKAGISSPAAFRTMLDEIGQKLKIQTESSTQRKQVADDSFKEKESKAEAIFAKGKLMYDEGKVAEAFYEWQNMVPYLQDGSQIKQTLESLKADHEALNKSEAEAKLAETKKDSKLATPTEFSQVFGDIAVKIRSQIQAAQDTQKKHESVLEDRKTMVMTSFEKGKELYADGRFEEAFNTWGLMLPALEDEGVTRQQIEAAKEAYQNLALAEKSAHLADERKDQKLKAPDGFAELISTSTDKIKIHTVDVQAQKAAADKAFQARQSEMMAKVAEGNKLYEAGRFEEAHGIWLSVMPSIENTQDFQAAVDELRSIHEERLKIEKISEQAAALQDVKFPAPAGITAEIVDARAKLEAQLKEAEAHKTKAEQQLASRQAQIQAGFEKGKQAYWDGKLGEAVQEWSAIADSLEDQSVRKSIQTVTESYDTLLKLQRSAQEAELKKDNKLRTPDELPRLLEDAKQIVTSQKTYSETQKKIADQTFVDRQALINTTYEKGKRLYNENRIPEALEEWGTITPYLENGSDLKQFIQGVQQSYDNSLVAQKAAQEAQVKRTIKFQSPEDLSALLEDASLKLKAQADASKSKKAEADKTRADRQLFIDSNFIRGKLLYEQGKLTEAIDVWKSLLPYLHDNAKVRELIVKAEAARRELADQQKRSKLEEDVREVILDKKASSSKASQPIASNKVARTAKTGPQLDDIEQMMLDYNIASKTELEKRHQELQAVK